MPRIIIKQLGHQTYEKVLKQMQVFTQSRKKTCADEIWCLQHPAVFTLGANADKKHILVKNQIPIVQTDRGGQITYHGPGQIVNYLMIDLRRMGKGVKQLVQEIESAVVKLLSLYSIESDARAEAHGVYVNDAKIASLGLRVKDGCSYHGLSLNVDMDLYPFSQINPCGFAGLKVTQMKELGVSSSFDEIQNQLTMLLCESLGYKSRDIMDYG